MSSRIIIGSRGSKLALVQAEWVRAQLMSLHPNTDVRIQIIKTTGDVKTDPLSVIGGKGVFTKELEDALLRKQIDLAVHSLKDLPTIIPDGLGLAAVCDREDARDALILSANESIKLNSVKDLSCGAVVGTSSPRRLAQLSYLRPDLKYEEVRGNVDTRLRKLDEGQYDALILAVAGLKRLGLLSRINFPIPPEEMLPAVGQGALGLQTRRDAAMVNEAVALLDHAPTRYACTAERSLLKTLGGGCQLPIAAHAAISGVNLLLDGLVASRDGKQIVRSMISGNIEDAEQLGNELGHRLLDSGASELL